MKISFKERSIEKNIAVGEEIITDIDYIKAIAYKNPNFEHVIERIEETLKLYVKDISDPKDYPCKVKVSKRKSSIMIEFFYTAKEGIFGSETNRNALIYEVEVTPKQNLAVRCTDAQFRKKEGKIVGDLYQVQEVFSGKTGDISLKNVTIEQRNYTSSNFEDIGSSKNYQDEFIATNTRTLLRETLYKKEEKIIDISQLRERERIRK